MTLFFVDDALDELRSAYAWYAERNTDVAAQFGAEIRRVLDEISEVPQRWPSGRRGFRKRVCAGFPYTVVYRWDANAGIVTVAAVAHQHRRPGYWARR